MSNEMTVKEDDFTNSLKQMEEINRFCESIMKVPHLSKMGRETVFMIVQKAKSIGVPVLDALNGSFYAVNGKIELSANAMNYLIRKAGHSITKDSRSDSKCCILHGKRKDNGDTWTSTFSIDDAKKAGIYKNTWEKYGEDMLFARALTRLARQLYADVIKGCYVEGEIREGIIDNPRTINNLKESEFEEIKTSISKEKAHELSELLENCPEIYKDQVWTTLQKMNIYSLEQITEETYSRIKAAAIKQIESSVKPLDMPALKEIQEVEIPQ